MRYSKYILISINILAVLIIGAAAAFYLLPKSSTVHFVNEDILFENKLAIPPLLEPKIINGEKVFSLNIQEGQAEFFPGKPASTLGYNGNLLGPTIRAQTGDKVRFEVKNNLTETTTVHWHGMKLPAAMDGGPRQVITPGDTWQSHWTIENQAATLWYHPHTSEQTGRQVYNGLAGFFIIDDKNSDKLNIPHDYGIDDIPLVVQDRKFNDHGELIYDHSHMAHGDTVTTGMLGNTIVVNGTRAPYLTLPKKVVRLRLLNGSNARRYNFGFANNQPFEQIATDGGLLERPITREQMILSPGERAEILVDLTSVTNTLTLISYPLLNETNRFQGTLYSWMTGKTDENEQFKILELRPEDTKLVSNPIPEALNRIEKLQETDVTTSRMFYLNAAAINNQKIDHTHADAIIKKGTTEIWTIRNESPIYHPFHIHGIQFQILTRDGKTVPDYEHGYKDTVLINPGETVKLIIPFNNATDAGNAFMYHCHILEHEDAGMMGQFIVVDDPETASSQLPAIDTAEQDHMMH
jgi:bilirubin oxidase